MINNVLLLGKIKEMPGADEDSILLEVKRNYKNIEGIFENDVFRCSLWLAISKKIKNNCNVGDMVAVKGRLVGKDGECNVIVEQLVLLNKMV